MVLLYSARFSRRSVTRPGSVGPVQSTLVSEFAIQFTTNSRSSLLGWALCFFGGMCPSESTRCTASQSLRFLRACSSFL
jgi:hypothetical protein